jgi:hypothetical protein
MLITINDHTDNANIKSSKMELTIPNRFKLAYLWAKLCGSNRYAYIIAVEYGFKVLRQNYPMGKFHIYYWKLNENEFSFDIVKI